MYVYMYDSCPHFFVGLFICALFDAQFIYQLSDSDSEAYLVEPQDFVIFIVHEVPASVCGIVFV